MTIYFNQQAEQYIEKAEPNSAGVFEQDGSFVAYYYDKFCNFDAEIFLTFNEAFSWIKKIR